jgi:hypothetical protein
LDSPDEAALNDRAGEQCGSRDKNFVIDGELRSGTKASASAPAASNSGNPSEWLDTSVGEETEQKESGKFGIDMK